MKCILHSGGRLMKCKNCNEEIQPGQKFCGSCGTEIITELQEPDKDTEPILENTNCEASKEIAPKKTKKKLPIIIGLIVLLIALAGGTTYFIIENNNTNKKLLKLQEGAAKLKDYVEENEIEYEYIEFIEECEEIVDEKQKDRIDKYTRELIEITKEAEGTAKKFSELKKQKLFKQKNWELLSPNEEELKNFSSKIKDIDKALEKVKLEEAEELLAELDEVQAAVIQRRCDELVTETDSLMYCLVDRAGDITSEILGKQNIEILELINKGDIIRAEELLEVQREIVSKLSPIQNYQFEVKQVDVNNFPEMKLYVSLQDFVTGEVVSLGKDRLTLYEQVEDGTGSTYIERAISEVTQLNQVENLNISVVADASGSMEGSYINVAKQIMSRFVSSVQFEVGDKVSVMSFADQVSLYCGFTEDRGTVQSSIDLINTSGATALYDALYTAVSQTAMQEGAKCVVAFTDGMDNVSRSTPDAVIDLASRYDIPVYIIGIGSYMDNYNVAYIATQTGGKYWDVSDVGMIEDIYSEIYREQKEMYLVSYETAQKDVKDANRMLSMMYDNGYEIFVTEKIYNPKVYLEAVEASSNLLSGEYIIPDSDTRYVTIADLNTLTQEQLRLARNEIYARRGRKFIDKELQKYFNSKSWYTGSVEPDDFKEEMLNDAEKANAYFIADYERLKGYLK